MSQNQLITQTEFFVKEKLENDFSGHDWSHVDRVRNLAIRLGKEEGGDLFIIEMGALLHDIADWKFNDGNELIGIDLANNWLSKFKLDPSHIEEVLNIIRDISYKGAGVKTSMETLQGKIVQDADRLDALGAIGIARTFAYGGFARQPMYDPDIQIHMHKDFNEYKTKKTTSINHFYEKLFLLPERMNTTTGKNLALEKVKIMKTFVDQFELEWNG